MAGRQEDKEGGTGWWVYDEASCLPVFFLLVSAVLWTNDERQQQPMGRWCIVATDQADTGNVGQQVALIADQMGGVAALTDGVKVGATSALFEFDLEGSDERCPPDC